MGTVWTIIVVINLCSLLFLFAYIKRLFGYARKYRMPESKYTLLFGGINLPHVVFAYVSSAIAFAVFSVIFFSFAR